MKITMKLHGSGSRYVLVGGGVYIFELGVIVVAQKLHASPVWAVAISFCLGTIVSFFLQKLVTFADKRMHQHVLIPQAIATIALVVWNFSFSILLTKALQQYMSTLVIRTLALAITTVWNFYLYKTRIFKNANEMFVG